MTDNKPVHSISMGTLQATIWENTSDLGTFFRLNLVRCFKGTNGWEKSRYFCEYDLTNLKMLISDCEVWIRENTKHGTEPLTLPSVDHEDDETPSTEN